MLKSLQGTTMLKMKGPIENLSFEPVQNKPLMTVPQFDGIVEDPDLWIRQYEKYCVCNRWNSD